MTAGWGSVRSVGPFENTLGRRQTPAKSLIPERCADVPELSIRGTEWSIPGRRNFGGHQAALKSAAAGPLFQLRGNAGLPNRPEKKRMAAGSALPRIKAPGTNRLIAIIATDLDLIPLRHALA